jgi:hypothetical protein
MKSRERRRNRQKIWGNSNTSSYIQFKNKIYKKKSRQLTRILQLGHVWMDLFELLPLTIYFPLISTNSQGLLIIIAYSFYKAV